MAEPKKKLILKTLKSHGTVWHPESTLVFKSTKDRLVIGRYDGENVIPLDDVALDLCEEWNFQPDESLLDTSSVEETPTEQVSEQIVEKPIERNMVEQVVPQVVEKNKEQIVEKPIEQVSEQIVEKVVEQVMDNKINEKEFLSAPTQFSFGNLHVEFELPNLDYSFREDINNLLSLFNDRAQHMTISVERKYSDYEERIDTLTKQLSSKTEEYDAMRRKFDAMKSLFS